MTESAIPAPRLCKRCHVSVAADKINPPPPQMRCTDHRCPLNTPEQNADLQAAWERTRA